LLNIHPHGGKESKEVKNRKEYAKKRIQLITICDIFILRCNLSARSYESYDSLTLLDREESR